MQDIDLNAITIDPVPASSFLTKGIEAEILRLDKIHPLVSGNKWFKLRFYLEELRSLHKKRIITFGGAWSNHILATAAACHLQRLECTGIIRGERPIVLSPVLQDAEALGMQLLFIDRKSFAAQQVPAGLDRADNYIIAAGGYGANGARGAATILDHCAKTRYTHICCAVGTGTMMAGLVNASLPSQQVIGISVLKKNFQLEEEIQQQIPGNRNSLTLLHDYHFGGYAKYSASLLQFMNDWYNETQLPTDFVYTGKLCFALQDLVAKGFFPEGSRILIIHSGGLTGNSSLKKGTLIF